MLLHVPKQIGVVLFLGFCLVCFWLAIPHTQHYDLACHQKLLAMEGIVPPENAMIIFERDRSYGSGVIWEFDVDSAGLAGFLENNPDIRGALREWDAGSCSLAGFVTRWSACTPRQCAFVPSAPPDRRFPLDIAISECDGSLGGGFHIDIGVIGRKGYSDKP